MLNFMKITKQFDQDALPIFCDEGVFRIIVDTYLQILIPMLRGFHAVKCVEYCIGKYIQESGVEGSLRQTNGVNVIDVVLNGTNYARSFKGYLILANCY